MAVVLSITTVHHYSRECVGSNPTAPKIFSFFSSRGYSPDFVVVGEMVSSRGFGRGVVDGVGRCQPRDANIKF